MSQQLEIIVMIDIEAAIKANTLEGNTYLFDNMKLQGSEGQGTDNLVTAINGTHYFDGSQADEQVLNWLPYGIGSLPPTLPKTFHADKSRNSDLKGLAELKGLAYGIEQTEKAKFTKIEDLIKFYAFLTNLSIQYIGVMESDLKPEKFHTYLQNFQLFKT